VLLAAVLATLEYDFEDGALAPFAPARGAFVLAAYVIVAGPMLFSGVVWRRWIATLGYAMSAVWLLFFAAFDPAALPGLLAAAVCLALAALILSVSEPVRRFFVLHEAAGGRLAQPLGPLASEADLLRWLAIIERWIETGALTLGERRRLWHTLRTWAATHPDLPERLAEGIERVAPQRTAGRPIAARLGRLARRIRRVPGPS
jgi:hypothetical protein